MFRVRSANLQAMKSTIQLPIECPGNDLGSPPAREPALGLDPGDDLAGHVLAQEPWEVVRLPAIADDAETHRSVTMLGRQSFRAAQARHSAITRTQYRICA